MKPVEHHRTETVHITEDNTDTGTLTLCGIELPVSPNRILGDGEMCENCIKFMCDEYGSR